MIIMQAWVIIRKKSCARLCQEIGCAKVVSGWILCQLCASLILVFSRPNCGLFLIWPPPVINVFAGRGCLSASPLLRRGIRRPSRHSTAASIHSPSSRAPSRTRLHGFRPICQNSQNSLRTVKSRFLATQSDYFRPQLAPDAFCLTARCLGHARRFCSAQCCAKTSSRTAYPPSVCVNRDNASNDTSFPNRFAASPSAHFRRYVRRLSGFSSARFCTASRQLPGNVH